MALVPSAPRSRTWCLPGCEDAGLIECRVLREGYRYLGKKVYRYQGQKVGLGSEHTGREHCFQALGFISSGDSFESGAKG